VASRKKIGAPRGRRNARITAPAKLVAACPDGIDCPTVALISGSGCGIVSKGRGRPVAAFSASVKRSAVQTQAAVRTTKNATWRLARRATGAASAIQIRPA
jgi:hypothetical protein